MANLTQSRVTLSLRQRVNSLIKSSPISCSSQIPNPNSPNSPQFLHNHNHFTTKTLNFLNSSQFLPNRSVFNGFNGVRGFATRLSESSSNRPPKETILLEGCDFMHWLVVVEAPESNLTRDEIIDGYIKTLAHIAGSEEEARMKIYSVSTRHYFAFGALVPEELAYKLKDLPHVRWVLPDSYMDVRNKTYAGEPFIDGQPVPYDPKYHEIWVRNNEQSLKNNTKTKRRQRDPNSRSRSPPSTPAPSRQNQNSMPASDHRDQSFKSSNMQSQISQPLSASNLDVHHQNRMPSVGSPHQTAQSSQILNPSPSVLSQDYAPHPSQMQNPSPPPQPQPQPSTTLDPNNQRWGSKNQNWTPAEGYPNQAVHVSQMHNQAHPTSPTSNSYTQPWNGPSQNWGHAGIQSQPPQSVKNNYYNENMPPSAPSRNMISHQQPQSSNNNYYYDHVPPSAPSRNTISHRQNPDLHYQGQSQELPSRYRPHSPHTPISNNSFSYNNMPPSASTMGMSSQLHNTGLNGANMPSQVQQIDYSYRDIPPHVQNGGSQNGHPSQFIRHPLNYQNGYGPSQGGQNFQANKIPSDPAMDTQSYFQDPEFPKGAMPSGVQQNSYSYRDLPHHVQNGSSHNGYLSHTSQRQPYQNNYRDVNHSNAMAPPPGWNYQSPNHSVQNSSSPNTNFMSEQPQNHPFQGAAAPMATQNNEFRHNMGPAAQKDTYSPERAVPDYRSTETVHTREYQERDMPGHC